MTEKRFKTYIQKAKEEFKKYISTKQDVYLAQAGEKLWNAYNILVEIKLKKKIRSFRDMRNGVSQLYAKTGLKLWIDTFEDAYTLHRFFYRGWTDDEDEIVKLFENTYNEIMVLKNLKV